MVTYNRALGLWLLPRHLEKYVSTVVGVRPVCRGVGWRHLKGVTAPSPFQCPQGPVEIVRVAVVVLGAGCRSYVHIEDKTPSGAGRSEGPNGRDGCRAS